MDYSISVRIIAYAAVFCVLLILIGAIIVVKIIRTPSAKKQLMEYKDYKKLVGELKETNKEMMGELLSLREKVNSIEKMLKDVE